MWLEAQIVTKNGEWTSVFYLENVSFLVPKWQHEIFQMNNNLYYVVVGRILQDEYSLEKTKVATKDGQTGALPYKTWISIKCLRFYYYHLSDTSAGGLLVSDGINRH